MWFEPGMTTIDADAKMSLLMQLHKKQIISRTLLLESWYGIDYDKEVEQLRQEQLMSQEG